MRITAKIAKEMVEVLEEIKDDILPENDQSYAFAELEREREKIKKRLKKSPGLY